MTKREERYKIVKRNRLLKKFLVIVTSLALGLTLTDFNPLVQETAKLFAAEKLLNSGNCGKTSSDNVQWKLYDTNGDSRGDKLVISGTGDMKDYSDVNIPWYSYKNTVKTAIVSDGVTSIGCFAFYECANLTSVSLPSGLTSIGDAAFYNCKNITLTELPSGITSIGSSAFAGCRSLALTSLPSGTTSIGGAAFKSCAKIALTELPSRLTSIEDITFFGCENITLTELPSGITSIGRNAFQQCSNLALTELPSGITSIGELAFDGCTELALTELPLGLTTIENYTFSWCNSLTSISIPSGLTSIGYSAFEGCLNLTSVSLPSGLTSIGDSAFYSCNKLKALNIPDSVTYIGNEAMRSLAVKMKYNPSATYDAGCIYNSTILLDCDNGANLSNLTSGDEDQSIILPSDVDPATLTVGSGSVCFYKLNASNPNRIDVVDGPIRMAKSWDINIGELRLNGEAFYDGDIKADKIVYDSSCENSSSYPNVDIKANIYTDNKTEIITDDGHTITLKGQVHTNPMTSLTLNGNVKTENEFLNEGLTVLRGISTKYPRIKEINNEATGCVGTYEGSQFTIDTFNDNGGREVALQPSLESNIAHTTGSAVTLENGQIRHEVPWKTFRRFGKDFVYNPSDWTVSYNNNTAEYTGDLSDYANAPRVNYVLNGTIYDEFEPFNIYPLTFSATQEKTPSLLKTPATCTKGSIYYYRCTTSGYEDYTDEEHTWEDTASALGHDFSVKSITPKYKKAGTTYIYYYKCSRCPEHGTLTFDVRDDFTYSDIITNTKLKTPATCTTGNIYYRTCTYPGFESYTTDTETFEDPTSKLGHNWNEKIVDAAHQKTAPYEFWYDCGRAGCDEISNTEWYDVRNDFTYSTTKSTDTSLLKTPADCTHNAVYYYACTYPGFTSYHSDEHTWEKTGSKLGHSWTEKIVDEAHKKSEFEYWYDCGRAGCATISNTEYWDIRPDLTFSSTKDRETSLLKSPATCTEEAVYYYKCTYPGYEYYKSDAHTWMDTGSALGHDFSVKEVTPVYKKPGETYIYYYKCSRCDEHGTLIFDIRDDFTYSNTQEKVASLLKTPATCTKGAIYYYHCTTAGYEDYKDDEHTWEDTSSVLSHNWTEKVVDEAHKKSEFEYWYDCGRTGCNTVSDTEYWDVRPDFTYSTTKSTDSVLLKSTADCAHNAVYYYKCTYPGFEDYKDDAHTWEKTGSALGHDFSVKSVTPVYKKPGETYIYYYKCSRCDEHDTLTFDVRDDFTFSSTKERDPILVKSPATCTKGAIYYYRCTTSGYGDYKDDGHTWEDTTSILGHDWSEKIVDEAHKKSEFEYWHGCGRAGCNEISNTEYWDIRQVLTFSSTQEKLPSLRKSPATCTKGAIYYYRCTTAGYEDYKDDEHTWEDTASALGHDFSVKSVAPVYKKAGTTYIYYYKCSRCDEHGTLTYDVRDDFTYSTTKSINPSLLKTPATCTKGAIYYYDCTYPGFEDYKDDAHTWEDTTSALGHDFTSKVEDEAHRHDTKSWWYNCSRCPEVSDTYYWYKHTGPMIDSTLTITPSLSISGNITVVIKDMETGDEILHDDASDISHQIPDDSKAHDFLITILTVNDEADYGYEIREQVKLTVQDNDYITKSAITPLTLTRIEETVFGIADVQERAKEDWEFPTILIPAPTPTPTPRPVQRPGSGGSSSSSSAPAPVPTQTPKPKSDFYVDGKATSIDVYKTLGDIQIPQMPGKVFDGWVDEQGKPLTSDTPVKADMKISATWKDKPTTPITHTATYSGSVIAVDFSLVPDADRYQLVDKDGNIKSQNINFNTLTTGFGRVYLNPKEYDEVRIQAMYKNQVLCDSSLIKISGVPMLSSNVKTLHIGEGATVNPMAYMTPSSAAGSVMSIKSTNPKVVKVTKTSMLKGVKAGKAKVTVKASDGSMATFNIKVIGTYKPKRTTLQVGDRIKLKKFVKGHTILKVKSANPKVAKVSKSFKSLTAKKKGNTTVIITVENYGTKTVNVKVKDKTIP